MALANMSKLLYRDFLHTTNVMVVNPSETMKDEKRPQNHEWMRWRNAINFYFEKVSGYFCVWTNEEHSLHK